MRTGRKVKKLENGLKWLLAFPGVVLSILAIIIIVFGIIRLWSVISRDLGA